MKKNDPQLCICPFDPSYCIFSHRYSWISTTGVSDVRRRSAHRSGAITTLRSPYEPKCLITAANSRWLSRVLMSVPVIEMRFSPKPKEMQDQMFRFVSFCLFFSCCGKVTPNNPASKPRSKWSVKLIPQGVHVSSPSVSGGRFPPSLCPRC